MKKLFILFIVIASCSSPDSSKEAYDMAVFSLNEVDRMQRKIDSIIRYEDVTERKFDSLEERKAVRDMQLMTTEGFIKELPNGNEKSALIERYKKAVDDANDYEYAPPAAIINTSK